MAQFRHRLGELPVPGMEEFERRVRASGGRLPCFCHGSNSVVQLRQRLQNPFLTAERGRVRGFQRIFAGYSRKWGGGGVASLVEKKDAETLGSIVYLTESEFDHLDRFEGIPEGADPFGVDFEENRYRRQWVRVEDGEELFGIAYVRNNGLWRGFPSEAYLTACARNVGQFWAAELAATGLRVFDEELCHQGTFAAHKVLAAVEKETNELFLHSLWKILGQPPAVGKKEAGSAAVKSVRSGDGGRFSFVADKKFSDVHHNLSKQRGWTPIPFLRASRGFQLKWRNYANCAENFASKTKTPQKLLLNHIEGSRCLGLKRELCWRLRAVDVAVRGDPALRSTMIGSRGGVSSGQAAAAVQNQYYPQCWDLQDAVDVFCFVANFTICTAHAALDTVVLRRSLGGGSAATGHAQPGPCYAAVSRLQQACARFREPSDALALAPDVLLSVLAFGTNVRDLRDALSSELKAGAHTGIEDAWPSWVQLNKSRGTWVLKPGGAARGEGIAVLDDLNDALGYMDSLMAVEPRGSDDSVKKSSSPHWRADFSTTSGGSKDTTAVAQLYVERPLLIRGKKFDVRQWVLVVSPLTCTPSAPAAAPLEIWFFDSCYLRFCAADYDVSDDADLTNRLMHLTNNSVQKHGDEYVDKKKNSRILRASSACAAAPTDQKAPTTTGDAAATGKPAPSQLPADAGVSDSKEVVGGGEGSCGTPSVHQWAPGLMWPSSKFEAHIGRGAWLGIQQRMKRATVALIQAHQTQFRHRPGCFEWLGLDFVISDKPDMEVHLLEANLSPDASHETSVLTNLCAEGYGDFFERVLGPGASASETADSAATATASEAVGDGASANTTCPPGNSETHPSRRSDSARHRWQCIYRETEESAKKRCAHLGPVARDRSWYWKQATAAAGKTLDIVRTQVIELLSSAPLQRRRSVSDMSCASAGTEKPASTNEIAKQSTESPPMPHALNSDADDGANDDDSSSSDEL